MAVPALQYLPGEFQFKVQCLPSRELPKGLPSGGLAGASRLILEWKDIDKCQYLANVSISLHHYDAFCPRWTSILITINYIVLLIISKVNEICNR
jgi:hypothetical protein